MSLAAFLCPATGLFVSIHTRLIAPDPLISAHPDRSDLFNSVQTRLVYTRRHGTGHINPPPTSLVATPLLRSTPTTQPPLTFRSAPGHFRLVISFLSHADEPLRFNSAQQETT